MSALDQALTKAYDKPVRTIAVSAAPAAPAAGTAAAAHSPAATHAAQIERLYHEGGLYRLDYGGPIGSRPAAADSPDASRRLSGPHYEIPPPNSPKRGMRRTILRLLANQPAQSAAPEADPTEPPRVRRKVIIRHVSHGAPVPPHHLPIAPAHATTEADNSAALPEMAAPIEVHGHWEAATAIGPALVFAPETADPSTAVVESLVRVELDAMPEADASGMFSAVEDAHDVDTFSAKSLDDDRGAHIRADKAHARGPRRPHLSFSAASAEEKSQGATEELSRVDDVVLGGAPADEPSAGSGSPAPAAPVWEVDRFHWPRTCEKLLADKSGYLACAGEKLVAAARDGLKTLAITGSRRGEGRTTLALCLARAAAKAGIHVALLDADFARPMLASRLGLEIAHGWQDAALGHIPLSEAAVKSLADNVTVLPLEITSARRSLSLSDPRVTATLRAAAATFELVIVDLGPLGPGEGIVFPAGERCPLDAAVVVRDLRFASGEESQDVGERLSDAGIEAVGVAENFVAEEE
jgi:Mrp family chromosome partitioning ATPase